ncbi:serine/arginine repetitive matrix protein 1-like [Ochlerotatus camptorhynchus]|uniref:serine/arginine repetitive matrix protein 1-like n=1 Tax=Ochlerotatus camptorhynchus TaxID=644619 RepID=UPI0031D7D69A
MDNSVVVEENEVEWSFATAPFNYESSEEEQVHSPNMPTTRAQWKVRGPSPVPKPRKDRSRKERDPSPAPKRVRTSTPTSQQSLNMPTTRAKWKKRGPSPVPKRKKARSPKEREPSPAPKRKKNSYPSPQPGPSRREPQREPSFQPGPSRARPGQQDMGALTAQVEALNNQLNAVVVEVNRLTELLDARPPPQQSAEPENTKSKT